MKCPEEGNEGCEARQTEPVSLIVRRGDVQGDRSFCPVPQSLAVAGDKPEWMRNRHQTSVNGFSRCNRLAPATVETFEEISKANPLRPREAEPGCSVKRDSPGRWRNSNGGVEVCGVVISGDRLDVRQRGNGIVTDLGWINNRQAAADGTLFIQSGVRRNHLSGDKVMPDAPKSRRDR